MGTNGGDHGSSPTTTQTASDTRSHPSNIHTTPTANAGCCLSESSTSCARDGNVNKSGNGRQRLDIQAATVDKVQADWAQQSCLTQGMQSLPSSTQLSASIAPAPLPSISNSVPSGPSLNSASAFVIEGTDNQLQWQSLCNTCFQEPSPSDDAFSKSISSHVMDIEKRMHSSDMITRAGTVDVQDFSKHQHQQRQQRAAIRHCVSTPSAKVLTDHSYLSDDPPASTLPRSDLLAPQDQSIRRGSIQSISTVASSVASLFVHSTDSHSAETENDTTNVDFLLHDGSIKKRAPSIATALVLKQGASVDGTDRLGVLNQHQGLVATVLGTHDAQAAQPTHPTPVNHRQLTRSQSLPSARSSLSSISNSPTGLSPVVDAHVNVPGTVLPPAIIPFAQPLQFVKPQNNNNSSTKPSTLVQGPQPPLFAPPLEPQAARPRRQSLLTPTQLKRMSEDTMADNANSNNIRNYKPSEPKAKTKKRLHDAAKIPPTNAERPTQHRPSARNTPTLTFQPHHTEISTDRPSVSGRLLLHIPKIPGKVFEFVSLTLTLRLKESISWTRQDLTKFEIQKESWSQIAWEKSIRLHFQDKQVEEGEETVVKIKGNSELVSTSPSPKISTELPADEWRWEWLMPVTRNEVWPESFEGSMGMVWYEMEAKCHFRWVTEGHDDVTEFVYTTDLPTSTKDRSKKGRLQPLPASAKFKKASTSTAKSLAQVFGKLRTGGKAKKANYSGDFNLGTTEHDKYLRAALQKSTPTTTNVSGALSGLGAVALQDSVSNTSTSDKATSTKSQLQRRPLPFLIRKSLKLYFVRPPPKESSNKAFFLPPPSMALPNLPDTRRLKAIIPGARIQVQIQIPNIIPIPGYAQTSQLVPCSKTGGLVPVKGAIISPNLSDRYFGYSMKGKIADGTQRADPRYPDNFQVALTVRKVTQSDIGGNDILRRRYEYAGTHSQTPSALVSSSTSTNISQTMSNSSLQGFVRSPILSQPQSPSPSSLRHDSHSIIESDDNITMGVTVEQTAIALGDQQKSEDGVEGPSASFHSHKISWRKEVRVRKVKCEFWQKESCRIPTEDAPSRSIKIPLGPAYVFLDQEQDKDTATTPQDQDEESNISLETNLSFAEAGIAPSVVREERKPPVPPKTTRDVQSQDFTSQPPPNSGCKGASGQIYPGSNLYPQRSGNKPFTLLVPIPLDSTSLRQTFVWPSSATPSSVHATPYNHSIGLTSDQGAGFGSDMEYPSYPTLCDSPGGSSRPGNAPGFSSTALVKASSSNKARIEVKHYLTFRLSIDMLEFEGEPEEDSADSNTLDEHQSPTNSNTRQELPTFPALCTSSMPAYPFGISPPTSPNKASGISNRHNGAMSSMSIGLASGSSSVSSGQIGHNTNLSATASTRISTIQPALTFLNSTAGLLGVDLEENDVLTASPFFGTSYEGSQRRGSKESLGTARSTNSGTSSAVGTIGGLHSAQTTSSISDNSLGSQRGRVTGEGLMAGAIGAIKKKASSSLLANVAGPYGHLHPGPQRASKVSVQKLKDFVLRVPITVVVEADDQSRVAGAFGTASSSGDQNGTTETNESATSISADKSMAGASGQLRQPPSLSNRALKDDRGGYTMPERSARFRGTSSLGSSSILDDQDLLASVGTNSIQSMEASVGSDRALDDTLEKFGALHFKPDYMLDQQNLQFPEDATDDIAAEYDDEEDFGFQY